MIKKPFDGVLIKILDEKISNLKDMPINLDGKTMDDWEIYQECKNELRNNRLTGDEYDLCIHYICNRLKI